MTGVISLFVAAVMGLGTGAGAGPDRVTVEVRARAAAFTVFFESTNPYPVSASLTFGTRAEAEAFAADRQKNGYTVRVVETP